MAYGNQGALNINSMMPSWNAVKANYGVFIPGAVEGVKQSLYDSAAYPAAGVSNLTFFQTPQGQGTGFGGAAKTLSDTNMQLAGQIPNMQAYLVNEIEIIFQPTTPGTSASGGNITPNMRGVMGADAIPELINDEYIFRRSGSLIFNIGQKPYLQEAPLWVFPSKQNFKATAALSDFGNTNGNSTRIAHAFVEGPTYSLGNAPIVLQSNNPFNIVLQWPEGVQAIKNPARVFVKLNGWIYRAAQ